MGSRDASTAGAEPSGELSAVPATATADLPSSAPDASDLSQPHGSNVTDAPPFWTRHGRTVSSVSYHSINQARPTPIGLEDHSEENHDQAQSCWAKSVSIDEYVVVSGATGLGAYVVWHCTVSTLKGGDLSIRKR